MLNEMQEVLVNQSKPDNDLAPSNADTEMRDGKITVFYADRLAMIATGIAFVIAAGAGALLRFGFGVDMLSTLGAALVVWAAATFALAVAKGSVFYFSRNRDEKSGRSVTTAAKGHA